MHFFNPCFFPVNGWIKNNGNLKFTFNVDSTVNKPEHWPGSALIKGKHP